VTSSAVFVGGRPGGRRPRRAATLAVTILVTLAVSVGVAVRVPAPPIAIAAGGAIFAIVVVWMFVSERKEWPLAVLALYLGLLDGFLKLATGSSYMTLGRDALLYAIVLGILARAALRKERLVLPPLSGWVIAFILVVLVQLFNPADGSVLHSLGSLRPHLEFVPLFFLGHQVLRTPKRLRRFFLILLVCASANGIVNFVQFSLTPQQLASWGPGYAADIYGTNGLSGRTFTTSTGAVAVRPFGLGSDLGDGAQVGLIALGAALALVLLRPRGFEGRLSLALAVGAPVAIFTGQGRSVVIAGVLATAFFIALVASARRMIPILCALVVAVLITVLAINLVASNSNSTIFSRYATVTPANLLSTTEQSRGSSIALIPSYLTDYPLGGGLGSVGPASGFAGGSAQGLNGETQFTFYISELGIPGLLLMLLFNLKLLGGSLIRVRRLHDDSRILIAAVATGIAGLFVEWASGPSTASSPGAPYFWFAAGVLSYWLYSRRSTRGAAVEHLYRVNDG